MELILFFVSSLLVILLTYKKSKVVSLTHLIMFIFFLGLYPFLTEVGWAKELATYWLGENSYRILHSAFVEGISWFGIGLSALLVFEAFTCVMIAIATFLSAIRTIAALQRAIAFAKKISAQRRAQIVSSFPRIINSQADKADETSSSATYLTLCHLRI